MKGPYERLKHDLRRVWECPRCGHRERAAGDVTFQICRCQANEAPSQQVCMKLIDDAGRRPKPPKPQLSDVPQPAVEAVASNLGSPPPEILAVSPLGTEADAEQASQESGRRPEANG